MEREMAASLQQMTGTVEELKEKVSAIQGNEALLFDPSSGREAAVGKMKFDESDE